MERNLRCPALPVDLQLLQKLDSVNARRKKFRKFYCRSENFLPLSPHEKRLRMKSSEMGVEKKSRRFNSDSAIINIALNHLSFLFSHVFT